MSELQGSNNTFTGKVFNGHQYWDIDVTTGEPRLFSIFETQVPLNQFNNFSFDLSDDITFSNERIIPDSLFSVPNPQYIRPRRRPSTDGASTSFEQNRNVNYTLDNNWVRLNNLDDFRVGDSITSIDLSNLTEFFIKYFFAGQERIFKFAIAPSSESYVGGPNQTPEVKAGLLTRSSMAIKTFTLAGGPPVYQVLGVEPTLFYLTGLFIGRETNDNTTVSTTSLTSSVYNPKSKLDAVKSAEVFDQEVAKSGRPIEVHLYSKTNGTDGEIKIKYMCLVQNARYFMRRSDRVYYALDLFLMRRLT